MTFTDQACSCHVVFASAGASGKPQVLHDKTNTNNEQIRFDIVRKSHMCQQTYGLLLSMFDMKWKK